MYLTKFNRNTRQYKWFRTSANVFPLVLSVFFGLFISIINYLTRKQSPETGPCYLQKTFAGVLNYLLCEIFALKILRHMFERSEFVPQNL